MICKRRAEVSSAPPPSSPLDREKIARRGRREGVLSPFISCRITDSANPHYSTTSLSLTDMTPYSSPHGYCKGGGAGVRRRL
jgi:hypothetical protein